MTMNTNALKRFAQEARTKLREQVAAKLEDVLHTDSAKLRGKKETLDKLRLELAKVGKDNLIDKVAYTWFNRFVALRFMDANDYQVLNTLVLTPLEGAVSPEILAKAQTGNIADELMSADEKRQLLQLFNSGGANTNPENEVYSILLVAVCNHLYKIFPFLFEAIDDYTELLLPDDLTSNHSIIRDIVEGMTNEDCQHVELIGWLYQFYISERKDEVAEQKKVLCDDLPAATQLFTPRWIVEYMVQNSLGKLWLQNRPNSSLKEHMAYYIESPSADSANYLKIESVEEIKLLDPACGSGHILVCSFDLLTKIYEEEGYATSEIPKLIIENNLYGYEIDSRAAQLAAFAVMMRARKYYRRYFSREISVPKILCYKDIELKDEELDDALEELNLSLSDDLLFDLDIMQQATNFGSLIIPKSTKDEIEGTISQIKAYTNINVFLRDKIDDLLSALQQLAILTNSYHTVIANPPYLGSARMNKDLSNFVKTNYPLSKTDLMACFMQSGLHMTLNKGSMAMINQQSWMFLSSYEELRETFIQTVQFDTMLHLGTKAFPEIGGEIVQSTTFVFNKIKPTNTGRFIRLVDYGDTLSKAEKAKEAIADTNCQWNYTIEQLNFKKIPSSPISYWVSENMANVFLNEPLGNKAHLFQGIITGNNDKFLRLWFEVQLSKSSFYLTNIKQFTDEAPWVPYNKGGLSKKWYGNLELLVNFSKQGVDFTRSRLLNKEYFFKQHFTWNYRGSGSPLARYYPGYILGDVSGSGGYMNTQNELHYSIGLINTKVGASIRRIINPTSTLQVEDIALFPIAASIDIPIDTITKNISISKQEWNSRETSWDFIQNELVRLSNGGLENTYQQYTSYWTEQFMTLHANEEELNRQFIDIYGLQDELTPEVNLEDITLLKDETKIVDDKLEFQPKEIMQQLVSYAVGCMFGRYSLDKDGLILANAGDTLEDYVNRLTEEGKTLSFVPDEDNIITVLDNEWFEDDIVAYFTDFMIQCFGEADLQKNMNFLLAGLGRKTIREYFVRDFYADHVQRYQKRPIYWMFSSPQRSFRVLVYLHRYTPDTLNEILNNYLREFIKKLNNQLKLQENISATSAGREQAAAQQQVDELKRMIEDCEDYEKTLYSLATERIHLDLDDGVYVNINKLGQAVEEVKGLNDKASKAKVRAFDWIDSNQIR